MFSFFAIFKFIGISVLCNLIASIIGDKIYSKFCSS